VAMFVVNSDLPHTRPPQLGPSTTHGSWRNPGSSCCNRSRPNRFLFRRALRATHNRIHPDDAVSAVGRMQPPKRGGYRPEAANSARHPNDLRERHARIACQATPGLRSDRSSFFYRAAAASHGSLSTPPLTTTGPMRHVNSRMQSPAGTTSQYFQRACRFLQ
jgi:hypothetical protein